MEVHTQLNSLISKSKEEFISGYKDYNETICRDICLQLFIALHKTIQEGNVENFKKLKQILEYIMDTENESKFAEYYNNILNPIKNTNLVLLACKHNKAEILEHLFVSDSIIINNILPINEDETHHNVFYYAIRSNNIKLLDTLIKKWPGNYFAVHLNILDEILCSSFEELLLKNVLLSEEIRIFVEIQLLNCRFFSTNFEQVQSDKFSLNNITDRIKFVVHDIDRLKTEYTNKNDIDERFLFIAKSIAKNIHILKQRLKSTYSRLPWEEIEFCLVCFISSHIKEQELNIFYHITLNKEKIINHLENFSKKLQNEQDTYIRALEVRKLAELPKLDRGQITAQIIHDCPEFESLYNEYQEIRDMYSLKKINNYIDLATKAKPKTKEGKLIITRSLQMIGEYVKDTIESPKLSRATNELLLLSLPTGTRKIIKDLRNSLSHAYSLFERTKIEQNTDIKFFIGIQNDITKIGSVITDILYNKKITTIRTLLKIIVDSENIDEIKEVTKLFNNAGLNENLSEGSEVLEHQFEKLIEELSNSISEKTNFEIQVFNKMYNIMNFDKTKLAHIKSNYLRGFTSLKAINILYERINNDSIRGLKSFANVILNNLTPTIEPYMAREIAELSVLILKSAVSRVEYETLGEINRISSKIFYIAEFGSGNFKWIEEFRLKLNRKSAQNSSTVKKTQTEPNVVKEEIYNDQLKLKLSELKRILDNSVLSEAIIENFPFYKRNKKLQAVVEMLVLDIMSILGILGMKSLGNNYLFLDGSFPLLTGKCLRNHMAHDNAIIEVLLPDPSISVILNAIKLITSDVLFTNKNQIGKCLIEDLDKLMDSRERGLDIISNQKRMFLALEEGNLTNLIACLKRGADLRGRSNKLWSSLHFAAKGTNLDVVKFVLNQNFPANVKDIKNQSPLHIAAAYGSESLVKLFVKDLGMYVNDADIYGKTSLHIAAQRGHKHIIEILLKNDANVIQRDMRGYSPLHYAVENNHKDTVFILLKKKEINLDFNRTGNGSTPLFIAAKNGHLELVNFLLQNEANPNAKDHNEGLPIHFAAINGYVEIMSALISKGANVNVKFPSDGCTPLHYAIEYGHEVAVNVLLHHGTNVNAVNNVCRNTPLHYAAKFGRLKILNALLKYKASVSVVNFEGKTPLHTAVQSGHLDIVIVLVKHRADIHAKDNRTDVPLHYAAQGGHREIAEFLIKKGAEINAQGYYNMTPLVAAVLEGHVGVTELFMKYKADVNAKNFQDSTPLHAAAVKGRQTITDILVHNKAKVNAKNEGGLTPLSFAAQQGNLEVLNILIKNGAKTNLFGDEGVTPLHAAVMEGHLDVVSLLIKHKADVNSVGLIGSPLHLAAETGNREIVEMLIDNGANIDILGSNNMTPLCSAIKNNRKNIVEFLIAKGANINGAPLLYAALDGYKDLVEFLLQNNVDIDVSDAENYTPLHLAALRGHVEIAGLLIKQGLNVNAVTTTGSTLLHVAVKKSHIEFMKILIANGAKINAKTNEGTPLHLALVEHGHRDVVDVLLYNGSDIDAKDKNGLTPLELAVSYNRLECVRAILDIKRLKVNWRLLYIAKENGNLEMIKSLIDRWTNVDVKNAYGQTILLYFVEQGQLEIVRYLIAKGANVNVQDQNDLTPLHIAASFDFKEIIEVLLKNGASYKTLDKFNRKPMDISCSDVIIDLLLSTEKLFEAVESGSCIDVENSIKKGAVVNTKTINGKTPLHIAAKGGYKGIVDILLENNANLDVFMDNGYTPLHYAAKFSHYKIVRTLLSHGAWYNAKCVVNQGTPLDYSIDQDIVKLLKFIKDAFKKVENSNPELINAINTINDIDTVRAIMNARNSKNKSLLIIAAHNDCLEINQLKEIFLDESSTEIRIAKDLCSQENYQEAFQLLEIAFEKMRNAVGTGNPVTLDIQCEIARVLYKQGNYQQSLNLFQEIYQKQKEILGANSKDTLNTKIGIALVLNSQGKYQEAFGICEEVYEKQKDILGIYHPCVFRVQTLMGLVLNMAERYEDALEIIYEVFAKVKNLLGKSDPVSLSTQSHIAIILNNQRKHDEALNVYKEIYERRKKILGLVHHDTLGTFHDMIQIFYSQNEYHKVLQAYEELLHDQESVLESGHIDALSTRYIIANLLFNQGSYVRALKYCQESFQRNETSPTQMVDKFLSFEHLDIQEKLCLAARIGDEKLVRYLLQNKYNANESDACGISALHYAVCCGPTNLGVINILLTHGADVTRVTAYGNTPLHTAVFRGYKEVVEVLLQHAIRNKLDNYVNSKIPSCGITCLHVAASNGSLDIVKYLLKCGAFCDIEDTEGRTPLDLAKDQGVYDLLKLIDELFKNVINGNVVDILKLKYVKPDELMAITSARNGKGFTLLQVAIIAKNKTVATKLIEMLKESVL